MRVLILEDNEHSRNMLVKIVKSCRKDIEVCAFEKRSDAYQYAFENHIDLFLVDIVLDPSTKNDDSGIAFADSIRRHENYKLTPIIFITTLQGLEIHLLKRVHCYDYIEKPIGDGKLIREHLKEIIDVLVGDISKKQRESISVHYDGIGYALYLDEVIYVVNRYGVLHIHTIDDVIKIPNLSTKKFLEQIKYSRFLEPVHGTAVNADYIESVDFRNNEVYLKGADEILPIGGRLKKRFREEYMNGMDKYD